MLRGCHEGYALNRWVGQIADATQKDRPGYVAFQVILLAVFRDSLALDKPRPPAKIDDANSRIFQVSRKPLAINEYAFPISESS